MIVAIDSDRITDWETFHDVFAETFGFPDFYGRNMDAWIDCMTHLDDPADGLSSVTAERGEMVTLAIERIDGLATRCPAIFESLVDCCAFVNWRRIKRGAAPLLVLSFYKDKRLFGVHRVG